jgi:peroxiredoxin
MKTAMTTNDLSLPLKPEQLASLAEINGKLKLLLFTNPEAFAQISSNVDNAMASIGASPASLSESAKKTCLASAGRFGGQQAIALRAAHDARQKADAAVVAGIPHDSLIGQLLKIMHGSDTEKLAAAWRNRGVIAGGRR